MATVTNPTVVKFCNEIVRSIADQLATLYYRLKVAGGEYEAKDIVTLLGVDNAATIADGSDVDGRKVITVQDVKNIVAICNKLITSLEASANADLLQSLKVAVNPRT